MVQRIKYFFIRYYVMDEDGCYADLKGQKVDAKELAEFIIDNAYNNKIMIMEVREI